MTRGQMNQLTRITVLACVGSSLWGQDAAAYLKVGDVQVKAGQYRQAVETYRKVILADPKNSTSL